MAQSPNFVPDLQYLLQNNLSSPREIIDYLSRSGGVVDYLIVQDIYAFALNKGNFDLEAAITSAYPQLLTDTTLAHDIWIYTKIYDRPDLEKWSQQYLDYLPWSQLLPIAMTEDIDPMIQISLLEGMGTFREEDLVLALVAAYRLGNQEMINYIGAMVGSNWDYYVRQGYLDIENLPSGEIPYQVLFRSGEE